MGKIHVLDHTGDSEVNWMKGNDAEQSLAAIRFNELTNDKGYLAFKTDQEENQGEQIKTFDPEAETIIMIPRMVGG